jgi:ribosomal protein S7
MVRILIKKYKLLGWDIENWKNKKNKFKEEMNYDLNKLMILNWILGRLNKKGKKAWSFNIIINILLYLKKNKKELPINILNLLIIRIKQNVLLFNKKKGTLRYELPRFVTIEQGIKKVIEWLIKAALIKNKNIIQSIIEELENIFLKKGEFWKKKKHIADTLEKNKPFFYLLINRKKKKKKINVE